MATTPTNLPVPSESPIDLKYNAGKIDEFVTALVNTYVDRFGNEHYTIEGLKQLTLQQIYNLGWNLAGTFQGGGTVNNAGDVLQDTSTNVWYRWDDLTTLPKIVPAGSTPESSGGTGEGKWQPVDISDVLRKDLSSSHDGKGDNLVMHGSKTVNQVINDVLTSINRINYFNTFGMHLTSLHGAGKSLGAENSLITATLLSKRNAVIDVDISTTKDNIAILLHDLNSMQISGVTGSIFDYTYSQVKAGRVMVFDGTPYQGTSVTSWDDFVKSCAMRGNLITAELKNTQGNADAMNGIYSSINAYKMNGRVTLQCLNISRLHDYRDLTGDYTSPLQLLIYDGMPNEDLDSVIDQVRQFPGLGLNIDIAYSKFAECIEKAEQYGISYAFWTANTKTQEMNARMFSPYTQITRDFTE